MAASFTASGKSAKASTSTLARTVGSYSCSQPVDSLSQPRSTASETAALVELTSWGGICAAIAKRDFGPSSVDRTADCTRWDQVKNVSASSQTWRHRAGTSLFQFRKQTLFDLNMLPIPPQVLVERCNVVPQLRFGEAFRLAPTRVVLVVMLQAEESEVLHTMVGRVSIYVRDLTVLCPIVPVKPIAEGAPSPRKAPRNQHASACSRCA